MANLAIKIPSKLSLKARTIRVELDRDRFEQLADLLGLYQPEFLNGLERSERDVQAGRIHKLQSLRDLRSK